MKLLFLLFFAFMHHISTSLSYDLEIEGSVRLEENFLKMFKTDKTKTQVFPGSNQVRMTSENDNSRKTLESNVINERPIFRDEKEKDYKVKRRDINISLPESEVSNNTHNNKKHNNLIKHISTQGIKQINYVADKLRHLIIPSLNIDYFLPHVTRKYGNDLKKYFNGIIKHVVKNDVEREFYILHVIESTNKIFADACIKLLESLYSQRYYRVNNFIKAKLSEEVQKAVIKEKQANLKYICDTVDVCRIYPAYSDRIANLLSYIANLTESNFDKVTTILIEFVESKPKLFSTIMYYDTVPIVISKMKQISDNPKHLRKFFLAIQKIINQRFDLLNTDKSELKTRTKAVQILIDMVDAAFLALGEDFIEIEFDNMMTDLDEWNQGFPINLQRSLTEFCSNIEEVLNFFWIPENKNEVKILVDVILTGTADNTTAMDYLLTKGSKLERGETVLPNLKMP